MRCRVWQNKLCRWWCSSTVAMRRPCSGFLCWFPSPYFHRDERAIWHLLVQWVVTEERIPELREAKSSTMRIKHAFPLFWRKTTSLSPKAFANFSCVLEGDHYPFFSGLLTCKRSWKDSLEQRAFSVLLVRYTKSWETHGELSPNHLFPKTNL